MIRDKLSSRHGGGDFAVERVGGDKHAQAEVIRSELAGRGFCCASHASSLTPSRGG